MRYRNPVWGGYFADPFVLRWNGDYLAYGTGEGLERTPGGGASAFKILRSSDLVHWREAGTALPVEAEGGGCAYWAPEVAERDGRFFLYYSRAPKDQDQCHRIRVAIADTPAGPYRDRGPVLPEHVGFCIDAHPFRDPRDGRWYLFFACDYFDERAGTGLAVVRFAQDMCSVEDAPRTVVRAHADWQIYERQRTHYGRVWPAWHTVEGPCVIARGGRYFCLYSGGNWQTGGYGVGFAAADHPLGPWRHGAGGGPSVLRERPGEVLGPGHNSYVLGPDGRTEFLVYHAWDPARRARRMCIDPLEWTEQGPICRGPSMEAVEL